MDGRVISRNCLRISWDGSVKLIELNCSLVQRMDLAEQESWVWESMSHWFAKSTRIWWVKRKSAPRMGRVTSATMNFHG
ncbi:hypothetical protein ABEB36_013576 [Hypothenemus hampei]|uniref:Uncharacterized protein n=1 Tax=Hypothenemus hampei TaxID=57062 RepID=A0ABD1E6S2_HYPHA